MYGCWLSLFALEFTFPGQELVITNECVSDYQYDWSFRWLFLTFVHHWASIFQERMLVTNIHWLIFMSSWLCFSSVKIDWFFITHLAGQPLFLTTRFFDLTGNKNLCRSFSGETITFTSNQWSVDLSAWWMSSAEVERVERALWIWLIKPRQLIRLSADDHHSSTANNKPRTRRIVSTSIWMFVK